MFQANLFKYMENSSISLSLILLVFIVKNLSKVKNSVIENISLSSKINGGVDCFVCRWNYTCCQRLYQYFQAWWFALLWVCCNNHSIVSFSLKSECGFFCSFLFLSLSKQQNYKKGLNRIFAIRRWYWKWHGAFGSSRSLYFKFKHVWPVGCSFGGRRCCLTGKIQKNQCGKIGSQSQTPWLGPYLEKFA